MGRGFIPPKHPQAVVPPVLRRRVKPRRMPIVMGAVLAAAILAVVVYLIVNREQPDVAASTESSHQAVATKPASLAATAIVFEPPPFSARPKAVESAEVNAELQEAVLSLTRSIRVGDRPSINAAFDIQRNEEEIRRFAGFSGLSQSALSKVENFWKTATPANLFEHEGLEMHDVAICRVEALDAPNEALVYTFGRSESSGAELFQRWWYRKSGSMWKCYDFQRLDGAIIRYSRQQILSAGAHSGNPADWCSHADVFYELSAAVDLKNWASVTRQLDSLEKVKFPAEIEASLLVIRGGSFLLSGPEKAIDLYKKSLEKWPDNPGVFLHLSFAFNMARQFDNAIVAAERYSALLKPTSRSCAELGLAYEMLHRPTEALSSYQMGVSLDPFSKRNLDGLRRVRKQ